VKEHLSFAFPVDPAAVTVRTPLKEAFWLGADDLVEQLPGFVGVIVGRNDFPARFRRALGPKTPPLQRFNHLVLPATRVTVKQHLAVGIPDAQARIAVIVCGAFRYPAGAGTARLEGAGDGIRAHCTVVPPAK